MGLSDDRSFLMYVIWILMKWKPPLAFVCSIILIIFVWNLLHIFRSWTFLLWMKRRFWMMFNEKKSCYDSANFVWVIYEIFITIINFFIVFNELMIKFMNNKNCVEFQNVQNCFNHSGMVNKITIVKITLVEFN